MAPPVNCLELIYTVASPVAQPVSEYTVLFLFRVHYVERILGTL